MPTPVSSSSAFASGADMVARYDKRSVAELCSDIDEPIDPDLLATNERLLACLKDASGMVEAACGVGDQYTIEQLQALTGNSLSMLKRLVCNLCMGMLFLARPDREGDPPATYKEAKDDLDRLRKGELIFGLQEVRDAGRLIVEVETPYEVERRAGPTERARRFFGRRSRNWERPN